MLIMGPMNATRQDPTPELAALRAKLAALETRSVLRVERTPAAPAVQVAAFVLDADRALSQSSLAGDAELAEAAAARSVGKPKDQRRFAPRRAPTVHDIEAVEGERAAPAPERQAEEDHEALELQPVNEPAAPATIIDSAPVEVRPTPSLPSPGHARPTGATSSPPSPSASSAPEMPAGGKPAQHEDPAGAGAPAPAPAPVLRILPPAGSVAPPPAVVQPRMPASRSTPAGGGGTGVAAVAVAASASTRPRGAPIPYQVVVVNPFPGFTGACLTVPANDDRSPAAGRAPARASRRSPATYRPQPVRGYG